MLNLKNVFCKKHCTLLALPIALCLLPLNAQAGCSRSDIDHYLGKGFTPSQITTICSNTTPASTPQIQKKSTPEPTLTNKKPAVVAQEPVMQKVSEKKQVAPKPKGQSTTKFVPAPPPQETDTNFITNVINGYDTVLTTDSLAYTIKKCYEVGEEDLFGFPPEVCPEIRYTLNLNGMKIVDTGRKYFIFGPPEIVLNGQITREILSELKDIKANQKKMLMQQIDTGDEVVLPIQQGTPMTRVKTELNKILR